MAYEPTQWKNGDIITAEKLNKLEGGVAGSSSDGEVFTCGFTWNESYFECDKTFEEIVAAVQDGKHVIGLEKGERVNSSISVKPTMSGTNVTSVTFYFWSSLSGNTFSYYGIIITADGVNDAGFVNYDLTSLVTE